MVCWLKTNKGGGTCHYLEKGNLLLAIFRFPIKLGMTFVLFMVRYKRTYFASSLFLAFVGV
jgi:hypothetical protein